MVFFTLDEIYQMRCILILAAFLIPVLGFSQNTEQNKVNKTIEVLFDGLAELSIDKIKQNSTPDLIILEHGEVWNMDTIQLKLNEIKALNPSRVNSFKFLKTEIKDKTAWVAYENKAVVTMNGKNYEYNWLESAVLVKAGNDWKVQMLHSTRLAPEQR